MRVHDSQAYRKMDVTRERISCILELREILLSIQTDFSTVNAAVACAILESISSLQPSPVITEPRYLKLVTVSNFCPFTLISVLMPLFRANSLSRVRPVLQKRSRSGRKKARDDWSQALNTLQNIIMSKCGYFLFTYPQVLSAVCTLQKCFIDSLR